MTTSSYYTMLPQYLDGELRRARARITVPGFMDRTARLAVDNLAYGLAALHHAQEKLGLKPDAAFQCASHVTMPSTRSRWEAGFAYGGRLTWTGEFFPIKTKPNACGVLVAGLPELPDPAVTARRYEKLYNQTWVMDGVELVWDFHKGNHFNNLYRMSTPASWDGFKYIAVIHSSGAELRGGNPLIPGLYPDLNPGLYSRIKRLKTPWGKVHLLVGKDADEFYRNFKIADAFSRKRRALALRILFPDAVVLFNESHLGVAAPGRVLLGCYESDSRPDAWVPLTQSSSEPAYFITPAPGAAVLPHGLGHQLKRDYEPLRIELSSGPGIFRYPGPDGFEPREPQMPSWPALFESARTAAVLVPMAGDGA